MTKNCDPQYDPARHTNNISSPCDRGQIVTKLGAKHVIYQGLETLCRKRISMLTGYKVSSLQINMSSDQIIM